MDGDCSEEWTPADGGRERCGRRREREGVGGSKVFVSRRVEFNQMCGLKANPPVQVRRR